MASSTSTSVSLDPRGSNVKAWGEKVATLQVTYGGRQSGLVELDATIRQN